jgi:uncharacterized protein YcbK (DUF882 family)
MVAPAFLRFIPRSTYASPSELYRDKYLAKEDKEMLAATLWTFDEARKRHGGPLIITSGRRTEQRQQELIAEGKRAAKHSAHTLGCALDVAVPFGKDDMYLVQLINAAAVELNLPRPRMGFVAYRGREDSSTFVHFDYAFLLPKQPGQPIAFSQIGIVW